MSDFIFTTFSSQVPSIKASRTCRESRQTAWLINRQEGKRTGWPRTIRFDYQTLSPDALYFHPAIRLCRFLNEKPAAEPVPDPSVGEESQPGRRWRWSIACREDEQSPGLSGLNGREWDWRKKEQRCAFKGRPSNLNREKIHRETGGEGAGGERGLERELSLNETKWSGKVAAWSSEALTWKRTSVFTWNVPFIHVWLFNFTFWSETVTELNVEQRRQDCVAVFRSSDHIRLQSWSSAVIY